LTKRDININTHTHKWIKTIQSTHYDAILHWNVMKRKEEIRNTNESFWKRGWYFMFNPTVLGGAWAGPLSCPVHWLSWEPAWARRNDGCCRVRYNRSQSDESVGTAGGTITSRCPWTASADTGRSWWRTMSAALSGSFATKNAKKVLKAYSGPPQSRRGAFQEKQELSVSITLSTTLGGYTLYVNAIEHRAR